MPLNRFARTSDRLTIELDRAMLRDIAAESPAVVVMLAASRIRPLTTSKAAFTDALISIAAANSRQTEALGVIEE